MRRLTTLALAIALLGAFGTPAWAGPPERYLIEFRLAPNPPDFTTGQTAPGGALLCPVTADPCEAGTAVDVGTVSSSWAFRPNFDNRRTVHGQHVFTSLDDGSSFTVRFQAVPDPTGDASFRQNWSVAAGSGRYEDLRGSGHGTVTFFFVSVTMKLVNAEFD